MVAVKVKLFAVLREQLGWREKICEAEGGDVESLLKSVRSQSQTLYDMIVDEEKGRVASRFKVLVNGRDIDHLSGLKTTLGDGDVVVIFPPVGGG